ncbi:LacI family transcriptional regulator [Mucilaginibacter gracilis]|uniref:Transcriptional regulator, LacI family n=2 Tax=Mucilaginibacter TaxID=423349 RepID=H1YHS0_9SPHI|nr:MULTISPECIES: LacI family DNA-binding transcriptional regulator [Mucilaginibacter]EHQ27470.1 transcriptional regulator, LacI family [Mucilaginibacter paludis DSM 18603]RKR81036.1 LacI family transcriptional regulator [Mucilaginibacter gracilis]
MKNSKSVVTIYDIAKKLNVSAATVSRSLNDFPGVNKSTKKKIVDTAREMGYSSNAFAANLRTKRSNTIGVIVPRLNSSFMSDVIAGIEKVANNSNFNLIISQSLETMKKENNNIQTMFNNRVDGLLVSLAYDTTNIDHFENFIKRDIPVIFFDRIYEHKSCPNIHINNFQAGYDITEHLIKQGCKKIIHITATGVQNVYQERFRGYKSALSNYGIGFSDDMLIINNLSADSGTEAAKQILQLPILPDGIFSANDVCAINCIMALKNAGLKVPQDIAVAGFNNDPSCRIIDPNLTTIDYRGYEMGEVAANLLINHLTNNYDIQLTHSLVLRHELIIRESSLKTGRF